MPLQAMMTPKDQKNQYPKKPMPLKATMAKPIIQYPVYAVKSDVDTERSNQTSILKPMPLKATMAKPRKQQNFLKSSSYFACKAGKTQQHETRNRFLPYRVTLTVKCKPEKPQV